MNILQVYAAAVLPFTFVSKSVGAHTYALPGHWNRIILSCSAEN